MDARKPMFYGAALAYDYPSSMPLVYSYGVPCHERSGKGRLQETLLLRQRSHPPLKLLPACQGIDQGCFYRSRRDLSERSCVEGKLWSLQLRGHFVKG